MTDPTPTTHATGVPTDKRAAPLRHHLERGGTVRLTARGDVERRLPSGQVAGRYGRDVLDLALAEGWLVEDRRRESPLGPVVEYRAASVELAEPVEEPKPKRAKKPTRVKRTTRPKVPSAKTASAPKPAPKPRKRKPRKTVDLPASPRKLADGTECVSRAELAGRWGVTAHAVASAVSKGRIDSGGRFAVGGHAGRVSRSVALTPRTLAYAEAVWGRREKMAFRDHSRCGGRGVRARSPRGGRVELVDGAELTQRQLAAALGYAGAGPDSMTRTCAAVPDRYVDPANYRRGRLYRVGPELVEAAASLGVEVVLVSAAPEAAPEPPPAPAPPAPAAPWAGREVELEAGAELLQGEVLAALGMSASASNAAARAVKKLRRKGDGTAWLYRVDDALVGLLDELGFAVTVRPPESSGDGAADVEDWRQLAATAAPTETPVFA